MKKAWLWSSTLQIVLYGVFVRVSCRVKFMGQQENSCVNFWIYAYIGADDLGAVSDQKLMKEKEFEE